jgi:hypothetical protein
MPTAVHVEEGSREASLRKCQQLSAPGTIFIPNTSRIFTKLHVLFIIVIVAEKTKDRWILKTKATQNIIKVIKMIAWFRLASPLVCIGIVLSE